MQDQTRHTCEHCGRSFRRDDHLARHQLSHGKARFQCPRPGCGMTFHRKDVLQRHEKVHDPDPNVRRRRPRRGTEPKPFIGKKCAVSGRAKELFGGQALPFSALWLSSRFGDQVLDGLSLDVLALCASHFARSGLDMFSFIHRTSLHGDALVPEKFLAMAVIGGSAFPEHKDAVKMFFERARKLLTEKQARPSPERSSGLASQTQDKAAVEQLGLFQAQLLLVEYGLWHAKADYKYWPGQCMFSLANDVVPQMVTYLRQNEQSATETWFEWIYQEQCVRTLWALYCTTQKSRLLSPSPFSSLSVQSNLRLPSPNTAFDAQNESDWRQALDISLVALRTEVPTFEVAFYRLMTGETMDYDFLGRIGQFGRHVLISALLDQYLSSIMVASNFDSLEAYCNRDLAHWKPRSIYLRVLDSFRRLWWNEPANLLAYPLPRTMALQNSIYIGYMEALMYGGMDGAKVPRDDHLRAVKTATSLIGSMARGSVVGLAHTWWPLRAPNSDGMSTTVQSTSIADGASEYFLFELAGMALRWCNSFKGPAAITDLEPDDRDVLNYSCEALKTFSEHFPNAEKVLNPDNVQSLDTWLRHACSLVFAIKDSSNLK